MASNSQDGPIPPAIPPTPLSSDSPSSATGMFFAQDLSATKSAEDEDFFAQFRSADVPVAAPAVTEPSRELLATDRQTAPAVEAHAPLQSTQTMRATQALPRLETPQVREVYIKPSAARMRSMAPADAPASATEAGGEASAVQDVTSQPGEFTRAFRAIAKDEAPVVAEAPAAVSPKLQGGVGPGTSGSVAEPAPGEFTRMFHVAHAPPPVPATVREVEPVRSQGTQEAAAVVPMSASAPMSAMPQEEKARFSQLLRAVTEKSPAEVSSTPAPAPQVKVFSITEILERLDGPKTPTVVPAPTANEASSAPSPRPVAPSPAMGASAHAGKPGSFTELMAGFAPSPTSAPASAPASAVPVAPTVKASTPPNPSANPGSITAMLQSFGTPSAMPEPAAASSASAPAGGASGSQGFTQFFQNPLASPRRDAVEPAFDRPPSTSTPSSPNMGGSFTQMMQALDKPSSEKPSSSAPMAPMQSFAAETPAPSVAPGPAMAQGVGHPGEFTRLMQSLGGPSTPPPAPAPPRAAAAGISGGATSIFATPPAAPAATVGSQGPSEFTQILSGSALRDARARASGAPVGPPPAPLVPGAMAAPMPGFSMPGMPPPPPMPAMQFQPPPPPPVPGVAMPIAAAPKTALEKYMPLLVIGLALAVLLLLIVLVFVLMHRK